MTGECYVCGRRVRLYYPANGDGSLAIMIRHRQPHGPFCAGSYSEPKDGTVRDTLAKKEEPRG